VHLRPAALWEGAVARLVATRLGAEPATAFTSACLDATGGNPLLLGQLLTSLTGDGVAPEAGQVPAVRAVGPRAVSRTVLQRFHQLPDTALPVAHAVAVLGARADVPLVALLTGLEEQAVTAGAAALARADILGAASPLGFVHPLVRDAVYHDLPPGERERRHAEAARLLHERGAAVEEVASHLMLAPRRGDAWVVDVLAAAAAASRRRGAGDSAVAYLRRAMDEPPGADRTVQLALELGLAEMLTSGPAAAQHLRQAWGSLEDPRDRAGVAVPLALTLVLTATPDEAVDVVRGALAEIPAGLHDERQALQAIELMAYLFGADDLTSCPVPERVQVEGGGPGARMLAAITAFGRTLTGGSAVECTALARHALADGVLVDADPVLFPTAAIWVLALADRNDALAACQELDRRVHQHGSLAGHLALNLWRGATHLWRGELQEAETSLLAAQENVHAWGLTQSATTFVLGRAFLGELSLLRGGLAHARELLDPPTVDHPRTNGYRLLLARWAQLLLAEGRHEDALEAALDLADRVRGITNPGWAPWRSLAAQALDGLGRTDQALELVAEELDDARAFGSPSVVGRVLRLLGTLERDRGEPRLEEAVALLEGSTAGLELAEALLALGAAQRRQGTPAKAREPLRRALELAQRAGAEALAGRARTELHAAGGRPRTVALTGPDSLTPSEQRVAELAADGRTNRGIAQTLYVTTKTVEVHLSSVYRKLGISSRRDLGTALEADP
jgi:DNA-binding CsgD family transcriptional regulator